MRFPFSKPKAPAPIDKKVVIIGGGYTGTTAARALDAQFDVTLITRQDCLLHNIGGLRASVNPGYERRVVIPLDKLLARGKVLKCTEAEKVDDVAKTVTLTNGDVIPYDYLIIAAGTLGRKTFGAAYVPTTTDAINALFLERQQAISNAHKILIIGGGPVGVELAGEIAAKYGSKKQVTLVSAKGLMEDPNVPFSDKLKTALKAKLQQLGVTVTLDALHVMMDEPDDAGLLVGTRNYKWLGGEGEFDLAIPCIGGRAVPQFVHNSGWQDKLEGGYLRVDEHLQVDGCEPGTVFAVGDITNLPETKLAYFGNIQATLAAKNITALCTGTPMQTYSVHRKATALVPVGPNLGSGEMDGRIMGNFITKQFKSKGLFVTQSWSQVGAKDELQQAIQA